MKRSEMIQKLSESFFKHMNDDGNIHTDEQMYSAILNDLENLGMLPPMMPIPEYKFQALNEWEPEDE